MLYGYFIAWLLFYGLHSLLASEKVKALCRVHMPLFYSYYRIAYNLFSLIFSTVLIGWGISSKGQVLCDGFLLIGGLLLAFGLLLFVLAFYSFDIPAFLGINGGTASPKKATLNESGLYAWVRHPLYSAIVVMILGMCCCFPYQPLLLFAGATFVYLPFGIYWEEEKLKREFGPAYERYAQGVKRLIPGVW